jgi:Zn-dependent protease with chaperone function
MMSELPVQPDVAQASLPVNDLAAAYQPRRVWAAAVTIGWNLLLAGAFLAGGGAWRMQHALEAYALRHTLPVALAVVLPYLAIFFGGFALANYPLELWFGYLEERQFGLAKEGIRAWTRDWLSGVAQHGALFLLGSAMLLGLQAIFPISWPLWESVALLALFVLTTRFALALLPHGLFEVEPVDAVARRRLEELLGPAAPTDVSLPPMLAYSAANLRDFSGGLVGLGRRQVWLVSRSALAAASDAVLRFALLHDLGHRRYRHLLLSTLAGWAWVTLGLCASHAIIRRVSPEALAHPLYIAWLGLMLSAWMALGEPLLAYLGRRLEYQADRYYLRHGGSVEEMRRALEELATRNLARTETLRRRNTMFHPLPSIWNRLHRARVYAERLANTKGRSA